jgi:hypothetical protein
MAEYKAPDWDAITAAVSNGYTPSRPWSWPTTDDSIFALMAKVETLTNTIAKLEEAIARLEAKP